MATTVTKIRKEIEKAVVELNDGTSFSLPASDIELYGLSVGDSVVAGPNDSVTLFRVMLAKATVHLSVKDGRQIGTVISGRIVQHTVDDADPFGLARHKFGGTVLTR